MALWGVTSLEGLQDTTTAEDKLTRRIVSLYADPNIKTTDQLRTRLKQDGILEADNGETLFYIGGNGTHVDMDREDRCQLLKKYGIEESQKNKNDELLKGLGGSAKRRADKIATGNAGMLNGLEAGIGRNNIVGPGR